MFEYFFLLFDYFSVRSITFVQKKGMKDIFNENKAEQPPADGASAKALAGGLVPWEADAESGCAFICDQCLCRSEPLCGGGRGCRYYKWVMNKVMIY